MWEVRETEISKMTQLLGLCDQINREYLKKIEFGGRRKEEEKSWGQFGYIKFEMPLKYVNDIR